MTELLRNAGMGWQAYTDQGKLAALFMASCLYLLMRGKREQEGPVKELTLYGAAMGVLCVFPPAAALLMLYQTRFYDYEWIWSLVPVTAVTAIAGTAFLTARRNKYHNQFKNTCYNIALLLLITLVILLSGSLKDKSGELDMHLRQREDAVKVLNAVREAEGEEFCLWAPKEILEYARTESGGICLLYGRNMWDISLNAYSYDVYPEEAEELYLWMERFAETGEWVQETEEEKEALTGAGKELRQRPGTVYDGAQMVRRAIGMGADCILMPEGFSGTELKALQEGNCLPAGTELVEIGSYILLKVG